MQLGGGGVCLLESAGRRGGHVDDRVEDDCLGAVTGGSVRATARPLHVGRTTVVVETEIRQGDRLISKTTQTQAVR